MMTFGFELAPSDAALWTILCASLSNASCAILGCYLLLRRMSLLGDAISHSILLGIAGAFLLTGSIQILPMLVGALVVGLLTVALTETLHGAGNVPEDASMGAVFTSLFAVGVVLIAMLPNVDLDPSCIWQGLIELAPLDRVEIAGRYVPRVLLSLAPMLGATLLFVGLLWKELKIVSFDPQLARSMGIPARVVHYLLMAMVAAVTVTSFEAVGSILVVAMVVVPPATAHLLTDRLGRMMVLAVGVGILSAIFGYELARAYDTSVSGMMAVVAGLQFCLAVAFAPRYGIISRGTNNLLLSLRIIGDDIVAMLYRTEEHQSLSNEAVGASWNRCATAGGKGPAAWLALPQLVLTGAIRGNWTGCHLTEAGRARAQSLVRAHRLWEAYLGEHFDLPLDHLHEAAERIEHYLGPKLQEQLATELSTPDRDPHGREIPPAPDRPGA